MEETLPLGSEAAIEEWIKEKGQLCDERLLVLRSQKPIRRMVDILALDCEGRLVFLEIKNEASDREVVGQVLEYLWLYREPKIEDLEDDFAEGNPQETRPLVEVYKATFDKDLQLQQSLRFVIIAPAFNANTTFGIRYLRDIAKQNCALVQVSQDASGFRFVPYELPALTKVSQLSAGTFGMRRSRLVCVLAGGPAPVVWTLGRRRNDSSIQLMAQPTLSRRCVQLKNWTVIPTETPATVDLDNSGSLYRRKTGSRWAVLIGALDATRSAAGTHRFFVCAKLAGNQFERFKAYPEDEFRSNWQLHARTESFPWQALLAGDKIATPS